jgi:transcriptional regulator of NAD metabolism
MKGEQRRKEIVRILSERGAPVAGTELAAHFAVSRQVIVQDVALLRVSGLDVISTNRGYLLQKKPECERVFKMIHTDDEVEEELSLIVDCGGFVKDVFVYHKAYGVVRADINIRTRLDIENYLKEIRAGKSRLLKNVTSGYHYHTIVADSETLLDLIQMKLQERGFLARLQDYEPVNFWGDEEDEK